MMKKKEKVTFWYSPLVHRRVVNSQTTENRKRFKNWNLAIGELSAAGMNVNQHADDALLTVDDGHAQSAFGAGRQVFAVAVVVGMVLQPLKGVVDVQNLAGLRDVLSNLRQDGAVYFFHSWTVDVGHAVTSLRKNPFRERFGENKWRRLMSIVKI